MCSPARCNTRVLAGWVAQGAVLSNADRPQLVALEAAPGQQIMLKGATQRLKATAVYADGSKKDVTAEALFSSSDSGVCSVDGGGLATAGHFGQAVVIVSYLRQPATVRIVVPQPLPTEFPQPPVHNKIDELVDARLRLLGLPPADLCTDQEFLRRAYLDVTGTLPSVAEARAYLADQDSQKRGRLMDKLLGRRGVRRLLGHEVERPVPHEERVSQHAVAQRGAGLPPLGADEHRQ